MTPAPDVVWRSACGRARIEERRGLLWCYLDGQHVATQLSLDAAKAKLAKMMEADK